MYKLCIGTIRPLSKHERRIYTPYTYVVETPFLYTRNDGQTVQVPAGFYSDGSTLSPDVGFSWIFHDYLYTTHEFTSGKLCSRQEADNVMVDILNIEGRNLASKLFAFLSRTPPFSYVFERHWKKTNTLPTPTN